MIKSAKSDVSKSSLVLKLIEENNVFYEIFGPNSHIQLINKSKELLEIMIQKEKLLVKELEIIWEGTRKGDLEGKLTILKIIKDLFKSFNQQHINFLSDKLYSTQLNELSIEEIDVTI
jgi:hypothetical protein